MVDGPVMVVELVSLQWLIGIVMIPGGGALLSILWLLRIIRSEQKSQHAAILELIEMHRTPDDHGFGTKATNEMVASIERTQKALIHYVEWAVTKMTGESPPPYVE